MASSRIMTANKKVEYGVVDAYNRVEKGFVNGFNKLIDSFVELYLTRDGETIEQARERHTRANQREEQQAAMRINQGKGGRR